MAPPPGRGVWQGEFASFIMPFGCVEGSAGGVRQAAAYGNLYKDLNV